MALTDEHLGQIGQAWAQPVLGGVEVLLEQVVGHEALQQAVDDAVAQPETAGDLGEAERARGGLEAGQHVECPVGGLRPCEALDQCGGNAPAAHLLRHAERSPTIPERQVPIRVVVVPATVLAVGARAVLGGYLAVHGAQKLFGMFGGHGLEATATGFESMGLTPGREMALLAGGSEIVGGLLTATGIADPLGPITIAGAMTVASAVHRPGGPMLAKGGFELPLTNLAFAALAGLTGGPRLVPLPTKVTRLLAAEPSA